MKKTRTTYPSDFKVKVALAAIKGLQTTNQIATLYGVHPNQVTQWKKQALDGLPTLFSLRASEPQKSEEELIATLYQQIGHVIRAGGLVEKKSKALH